MFVFAALLVSNKAYAATSVLCAKGNNLVTATKCPPGYKKLTLSSLAGKQGDTGPSGSNGLDGSNGILDISSCRHVINQCNLNTGGACTASCNSNEFILQHAGFVIEPNLTVGCAATSGDAFLSYTPSGVANSAEYIYSLLCAESYTAVTELTCCPVN